MRVIGNHEGSTLLLTVLIMGTVALIGISAGYKLMQAENKIVGGTFEATEYQAFFDHLRITLENPGTCSLVLGNAAGGLGKALFSGTIAPAGGVTFQLDQPPGPIARVGGGQNGGFQIARLEFQNIAPITITPPNPAINLYNFNVYVEAKFLNRLGSSLSGTIPIVADIDPATHVIKTCNQTPQLSAYICSQSGGSWTPGPPPHCSGLRYEIQNPVPITWTRKKGRISILETELFNFGPKTVKAGPGMEMPHGGFILMNVNTLGNDDSCCCEEIIVDGKRVQWGGDDSDSANTSLTAVVPEPVTGSVTTATVRGFTCDPYGACGSTPNCSVKAWYVPLN